MTSEPRVNCQREGKGLVRVGLSDKGVGTSTLSLSLSLALSVSFIVRRYSISLSFSCNLLLRVMARAHPLFFPLFAFLISFSSVDGFERAHERAFCRADQAKQWFTSRRIKSKTN